MTHDYKKHDPKGWMGNPMYGAALGRGRAIHDIAKDKPVKMALRRVPINNGGYDSNGTYWGVGQPLYWYAADDGDLEIDGEVRADNREHAKGKVLAIYPKAKFYR